MEIIFLVYYSIKAQFIEEKMSEFYQKLTDGTIENQKPDGQEIINSMKRAKITSPKTIQWSEICFCSPYTKTRTDNCLCSIPEGLGNKTYRGLYSV